MATFRSFAKINLSLRVAGRRADGYHELSTVFQTIDLADELEIRRRRRAGVELEVRGADLPSDERNLAYRAAEAFLRDRAPAGEGVSIRLEKRIPVGAGLGGGSANAATVLLALERLFAPAPDPGWLQSTARWLGADVPFFLVGGTALGAGRGDVIRPLADAPPPRGDLVLLLPAAGLSTAEVFAAFGAAPIADRRVAASGAVPTSGAEFAAWVGVNDLEAAAFRVRPALAALYTAAVRSGARRVRMSGSGSTLFALYDAAGAAAEAARFWPPDIVWKRVETLDRAAWRSAGGWAPARGE
ncbi:MAG TPA: 4-(cytidine 5'-diphospho)-2-C-methyl-D-erythritol kinase [Thermoanaerobaculia bacterium]